MKKIMADKIKKYDVAVIGGGPAGIMAAIQAGRAGAKTVLVEKNDVLGKKLLLTGGGRCNFANNEPDLRKLVENYGATGPFLFHAFSEFGPKEAVRFFNDLGIETVVEDNGRVFPKSGLADEVLQVLVKELEKNNVKVFLGATVASLKKRDKKISEIVLNDGDAIKAENYIIATGGKSYPATGSTGDGYNFAHDLGHRIEKLKSALVPLKTSQVWAKKLSGVSLKRSKITVEQGGKKIFYRIGEIIFTHFGLSGPAILGMSLRVGELMEKGPVVLSVCLLPESNHDKLEKDLLAMFSKNPNRQAANILSQIVPQSIAAAVCEVANISAEKTANNITREERHNLCRVILDLRLDVAGLMGIETGMVTGGGVDIKEVDDKTMRSKIIGNLFFAGEIINVHGRTGGYNLLQCWSTGRLAGSSAVKS